MFIFILWHFWSNLCWWHVKFLNGCQKYTFCSSCRFRYSPLKSTWGDHGCPRKRICWHGRRTESKDIMKPVPESKFVWKRFQLTVGFLFHAEMWKKFQPGSLYAYWRYAKGGAGRTAAQLHHDQDVQRKLTWIHTFAKFWTFQIYFAGCMYFSEVEWYTHRQLPAPFMYLVSFYLFILFICLFVNPFWCPIDHTTELGTQYLGLDFWVEGGVWSPNDSRQRHHCSTTSSGDDGWNAKDKCCILQVMTMTDTLTLNA